MKVIKKLNEKQFDEIMGFIQKAKANALKLVNYELITLYCNIGEYISEKIQASEWGESVIEHFAEYIALKHP